MRKIEVVDYNPKWPELFELERNVLENILQDIVATIHHIGSTAVPGLAAKPIIDILVEVSCLNEVDAMNGKMKDIGYNPKGEFGIVGRRYFEKGGDIRTHHIHAFVANDPNIKRHIAFRDYLRANQTVADQYGKLKKSITQGCDNDIRKYCDGKDGFVKKHEALAIEQMTPNKSIHPSAIALGECK